MREKEILLTGGRVTPGVVRIGETVRRPLGDNSAFSHPLLKLLQERGFDGAPRLLGLDELNREILTYLPGEVPDDLGYFNDCQIATAAHLLCRFHDATAGSALCAEREVVCHGDASPCNCVFRQNIPYGLIDFDNTHPGDRREDVGYAAWLWLDIGNSALDPRAVGLRLARFVVAYRKLELVDALQSVLDAQSALATDRVAPVDARAWAVRCREWTVGNQRPIERGIGDL